MHVNIEKAPAEYNLGPKGTLWGWLFPKYEVVGPNVPQQDHWFIPQLDVPTRLFALACHREICTLNHA